MVAAEVRSLAQRAAAAAMDDVTQQNAALVEQAAAAAQSMCDQAYTLAQLVSVFKLAGAAALGATTLPPIRVGHSMTTQRRASSSM